jgi:hypothetical protein
MIGCPEPDGDFPKALSFRVYFSGRNGEFVRVSRLQRGDVRTLCSRKELSFVERRLFSLSENALDKILDEIEGGN